MKKRKRVPVAKRYLSLLLLAMMGLLAGCSDAADSMIDTSGYPDPPEDERLYTVAIYWQLDILGGDSPSYSFDREGVVEEGNREDPNVAEPDSNDVEIFDATPPGGRDYYFRGVAPGDVVLTMRNEKKGKTTYERKYVLRVYDDLRLVLLDVIGD